MAIGKGTPMRNVMRWVCWVGLLAAMGLTGCGPRVWVMVPPNLELRGYQRVGLVEFSGNDPALSELATRQFQEAVLSAQPGVRVVEITDDAAIAGAGGRGAPDPEAMHRVASKYNVDALFVGDFEISKATPRIDVSTSLLKL